MQQKKYQSLGKILSTIAQDYHGLLAQIEGHVHMLERQAGANTLLAGSVRAIIKAVEQGSALTRRLIELGEFPPDPVRRGDLVSAVQNNQVLLRSVLGSGAKIEMHLPEQEIYIPLCEEGVTQILISCVLDARDRHAGLMTVSVSVAAQRAILHVADNGTVIAPQRRQDVSHEWQMVHEWVQTGSGTMKSALHAESGGDVLIAFPLGIQCANPFADKTVLVVDNGEGLPDLVEAHLQPFGMRVLKAANAEQALVMHKQTPHPIDVLLTDAVMPELNGVQLAQMLVADNPQMRVVYMTGAGIAENTDDEMAAILKSAITLQAPVSMRGLSSSLEKALQSVQDMVDQGIS